MIRAFVPGDFRAATRPQRRAQLVVRDGVASFFHHPFLGLEYLPWLVEDIQALGRTFAPARDMILPKQR